MTTSEQAKSALEAFNKAENSFNEFHPECPEACGLDLDLMFNYAETIRTALQNAELAERWRSVANGVEKKLLAENIALKFKTQILVKAAQEVIDGINENHRIGTIGEIPSMKYEVPWDKAAKLCLALQSYSKREG